MTDDFNAHLGLVVRRIRRNKELTQEQLADRVGLTRTSVTNIERGSQGVSVSLMVDLARSMDADPVEILAESLRLTDEAATRSTPVPSEIATGVASSELRDWVLGMVQQDTSSTDSPASTDADEFASSASRPPGRRSPGATVRAETGGRK